MHLRFMRNGMTFDLVNKLLKGNKLIGNARASELHE